MLNFQKILDFLIPRRCAGCGGDNEVFCRACRAASFQKSAGCILCGFRNNTGEFCPDCKRKFAPPLKSVLWAGRYDGELKKAIWELKYGKRRELARPLAEMLAEKFLNMRVLQNAVPAGNFLIIPIPLHFKRQYERGFNQAELLAREFSKITCITMRNDILEKTKETPAQVKIENKELRLKNLEGAFKVSLGTPVTKWPSIILIDDVATTGATLMHAAEALKNAGAKEIIGLVIAHG
ncbi:MAG: ComF family protein [bacterium]|nr:ComF family protein [bacterium]